MNISEDHLLDLHIRIVARRMPFLYSPPPHGVSPVSHQVTAPLWNELLLKRAGESPIYHDWHVSILISAEAVP